MESFGNDIKFYFFRSTSEAIEFKLKNTVCVRIKNCWKSFSNIQIATYIMDSYRKKNCKDIKYYFFDEKDNINKKRTEISFKAVYKTSFPKNSKRALLSQEWTKIKSNNLSSVKLPQITINKQIKLKTDRNYNK